MLKLSSRFVFIAMAAVALGLVAGALVLQHFFDLNPCPLCILQRIAFLLVAVFAIVGAVVSPRARIGLGAAAVVSALVGAGFAAWHVRLLGAPQALSCGPGLATMLENFPLSQTLPKIFAGSGDCTDTGAAVWGLSLAAWALIGFAGLIFGAFGAMARR